MSSKLRASTGAGDVTSKGQSATGPCRGGDLGLPRQVAMFAKSHPAYQIRSSWSRSDIPLTRRGLQEDTVLTVLECTVL
jgi:hypothetical protein